MRAVAPANEPITRQDRTHQGGLAGAPDDVPANDLGASWPRRAWQRELADAVTDVRELLALVGVVEDTTAAATDFPLRVPRPYIARMRRGDAADPLLRQVLPTALEARAVPGYSADPLLERSAASRPGILRKYAGRALLIASGACAVHCRYCFRRHFPYAGHRQNAGFPGLASVRADPSVREVILSGGDPLLLTDGHFARLVDAVANIDHVRTLRIHTRLPVVIPQRVTATLVDTLTRTRLRVVVVAHFNHGNEIDPHCASAMAALRRFTLLNQSVLLRGINDDADVLTMLSERLFDIGVLPYYLHMPDAVAGTAHFDVSETDAVAIHRRLAAALPGYLVPRLVREVPGAEAKQPLPIAPP